MKYVLLFVSLALISQIEYVSGYLIVQDEDSSSESEGDRGLSLKQRLDNLEANLAKLQENTEPRTNCSATHAPINVCPDGWVLYNGSCYYFGRENLIFERAKEFCAAQNASLVHIETKAEDEFLKSFQQTFTVDVCFWLGMTDAETEGVWRWYDNNSTANYVAWAQGEPNDNFGVEDCAVLICRSVGWVDLPCTAHAHRVLCEKTYISAYI